MYLDVWQHSGLKMWPMLKEIYNRFIKINQPTSISVYKFRSFKQKFLKFCPLVVEMVSIINLGIIVSLCILSKGLLSNKHFLDRWTHILNTARFSIQLDRMVARRWVQETCNTQTRVLNRITHNLKGVFIHRSITNIRTNFCSCSNNSSSNLLNTCLHRIALSRESLVLPVNTLGSRWIRDRILVSWLGIQLSQHLLR